MCPACDDLTPLDAASSDVIHCNKKGCKLGFVRCQNGVDHGICNRLTEANESNLCDYCRLTTTLPDLSIPQNQELWKRLERAKHRVLYSLERNGFPFGGDLEPKLSFQFLADGSSPVVTGHQQGLITINLREADSVAREIARVQLGEPQRTLVGHFRHELGHYFWDRLVAGQRDVEFRKLFGDERAVVYESAQRQYYDQGPPSDWSQRFVSAYAAMHPWEDFAETFGAYHDMLTVIETANHFSVTELDLTQFDGLVRGYAKVGVMANEFNRDMGLLDLVPEIFVPAVIPKLRYIHSLRLA